MRLFLLLVAIPIIEIGLFIEVGGLIGTWPTIGIVILTAFIGSVMLRRQGLAVLSDVQGRLASGESPGRLLADGAMILFSGALLLTPGFFTDAVGFALLIPGVRTVLWNWGMRNIKFQSVHVSASASFRHPAAGAPHGPDGQTVDGEFTEVNPDPGNRPVQPGIDKRPGPD